MRRSVPRSCAIVAADIQDRSVRARLAAALSDAGASRRTHTVYLVPHATAGVVGDYLGSGTFLMWWYQRSQDVFLEQALPLRPEHGGTDRSHEALIALEHPDRGVLRAASATLSEALGAQQRIPLVHACPLSRLGEVRRYLAAGLAEKGTAYAWWLAGGRLVEEVIVGRGPRER